ncbi:hypothetical protein KSP40_PGU019694 [Platanthera guangdongensis]|uniref:Uncharacterized protein n=1 Tax=Platanthera guangdongensis TaxID=2320717 RepID=A0ABR2N5P4_9ASPA
MSCFSRRMVVRQEISDFSKQFETMDSLRTVPYTYSNAHDDVPSNFILVLIHVIAHCVGGLAVHIALLGGHVSARKIASLSCTSSSMYFKLTKYALVKMKLPLLPVTMAVLGRNTILSITDSSKDEFRHSLLKSIARIIPRPERCISDECEIFSGVFGNAFLHSNISKTLHRWLIKENITHLPMSGLPHLRKICSAGFIVDAEGMNKYLIHSERMALPTLYVSGGKSLLLTQETSLLAYRYMSLHQPGFEHKRVVVEGFGHSDLLIGQESHKNVFPHFLSHMRMAEGGGGRKASSTEVRGISSCSWEAFFDSDGGSTLIPALFVFLLAVFFFLWKILYI